jgi:Tfp pilus tip-associated adhesin PilY1
MKISKKATTGVLAASAVVASVFLGPNRSRGDDTSIFTAQVPPNVMILLDNSGSMNEIMWHPAIAQQADLVPGPTGGCTSTTCLLTQAGNYVNAPAGTTPNCPIFGIEPPNSCGANSPSPCFNPAGGYPGNLVADQGGLLNDANAKPTNYWCDHLTKQCRFQIDTTASGFTSTGSVTCPSGSTVTPGYITRTFCGRTRNMYVDAETLCEGNQTWWTELYVEWYFSANADKYFTNGTTNSSTPNQEANTSQNTNLVDANLNGQYYIDGTRYPLYKISRIAAAKSVAKDVIFQTDTNCAAGTGNRTTLTCPFGVKNAVRFGLAQFDTANENPGAWVKAPIADYDTAGVQATALDKAIGAAAADASTPLAESLFKVYTYFMPRNLAQVPKGKDGVTQFPVYQYSTVDGSNAGVGATVDPLKCPGTNAPCNCQKNFVMIITDGFPTHDDFAFGTAGTNTTGRTVGFGNFLNLIGAYPPPLASATAPQTDVSAGVTYAGPTDQCTNCEGQWRYLPDVAAYMHMNNFRPDLCTGATGSATCPVGPITLDVYTVGLATGIGQLQANANRLLQETALNGGGGGPGVGYFTSSQSGELVQALTTQIQDILLKSQSFTAATVPASRTSVGGNFYITQFLPSDTNPFWQGHLMDFQITLAGQILDSNGNCAVNDSTGNCQSGPLLGTAVPFWDAGAVMPNPGSRRLYFSEPGVTAGNVPVPWSVAGVPGTITNTTLNIPAAPFPTVVYPGSNATNAVQLTDEIVAYTTGCTFGTGVQTPVFAASVPCTNLPWLLGDIFHSNPVIVGSPAEHLNEPSYQAFSSTYQNRNRLIYAGANDGFLHAFAAGTWQTTATAQVPTPPGYDRGTGVEQFGFMPWSARATIKYFPVDVPNRTHYYVDGSPHAADVWFPSSPTATTKNATDWHTILVGGMRQGGSDPNTPSFTENGTENSTATITGLATTAGLYVGESVTGAHIPANTTITTIKNNGNVILSAAATGSLTETLGFGGLNGNYYALDITNPNGLGSGPNFPAYLWEFPAEGSPATLTQYLGQTWSDPVITRIKIAVGGNNNNGQGFERWVVIVGGGYDPSSDPNTITYNPNSTLGRAIFVLDAETGQVIAQKVFTPSAPASDMQSQMFYAIPSTPAVFDLNFDTFADVIYVGDLGGNVWKWSITNVCNDPATLCTNSWPFTLFFSAPAFQSTPAPAGTAVANAPPAAGDHYKSFFFPPVGTFENSTLWVGFGTGERANLTYPGVSGANVNNNNRFYGMSDTDPFDQSATPPPTLTEANLLDVTSPLAATSGGTCTPITQRGWYFLASTDASNNGTGMTCSQAAGAPSCTVSDPTSGLGEKFITAATIFAGNVFVSSFIPNPNLGTDPCASGGNSFLYTFTIQCAMGLYATNPGTSQRTLSLGAGMPTDPRISISVGNVPAGTPGSGTGSCSGTANKVVVITSSNTISNTSASCGGNKGVGILYWREHQ